MTTDSWPDRPRVLLSYAYLRSAKRDSLAALPDADIIIDSGAFTAHNSGAVIHNHDYIPFLMDNAAHARFAFALDVIGDPAESYRNWTNATDALGDKVKIVPTWHIGSPLGHLDKLCSETDYVSIGGAVPHYRRRDALMRELIRAHRTAAEHGTRLHGLGITATDAVIKLPWASVDSSSWSIPGRMPYLYLSRRDGRMFSMHYGEKIKHQDAQLIRAYGGDPEPMSKYGYASTKTVGKDLAKQRQQWAVLAACRSYMHRECVKRNRDKTDFRLYLATSPNDLRPFTAYRMGPIW